MTHTKTTLLACSILAMSCFMPTLSQANETDRLSPLHIKLSPTKTNKSVNSINIQGTKKIVQTKTKITTTKEVKETQASVQKQQKPQKSSAAAKPKQVDVKDILNSVSCKKSKPEPSKVSLTSDEELVQSLRSYLETKNLDPNIVDTLYDVSQSTNTDFQVLVITAMIESDLGRVTISSKSTARGMYQFIEPTWLVLMKRYGSRIGYKSYADAISFNAQTRLPEVNGGVMERQKILDLRYDNRVASLIKAYQINDEKRVLDSYKNGQRITITDHYIAHMLGLSLARTFYKLKDTESDFILANLKDESFKQAIKLNKSFFYDRSGNPLTASQAYVQFDKKISSKFDTLKTIKSTHSPQNVHVKGPTLCPSENKVQSVSADDILSHDIKPLPQTEKVAETKAHNILTQFGSYAKTVKVKMVQSEE